MGTRQDIRSPKRSVGSVLRSVTAMFALAILVCGVPWVIIEWGAWTQLVDFIHNPSLVLLPDDGNLVLAILTGLGAIFWVILAISVLMEIVEALRRRNSGRRIHRKRSTFLRLGRALVRPLVSAAFTLAVIGGGFHASAEEPESIPRVSAPAWVETQETFSVEEVSDVVLTGQPDFYVVEPGDSLWSIAERIYGDGREWMRIAEANEDLINGVSDIIHVGWKLTIPPRTTPEQTCPVSVVVEPGDSLWSIAESHLGDGDRWPDVARVNPTLVHNPRVIEPGWELSIPCDVLPQQTEDSSSKVVDNSATSSNASDMSAHSQTIPSSIDELSPSQGTHAPVEESPKSENETHVSSAPREYDDPYSQESERSQESNEQVTLEADEQLTQEEEDPDSDSVQIPQEAVEPRPGDGVESDPGERVESDSQETVEANPEAAHEQIPEETHEQNPQNTSRSPFAVPEIIGVSAALACGISLMLSRRRLNQLRSRQVGKRIFEPSDDGRRFATALDAVGSQAASSGVAARLTELIGALDPGTLDKEESTPKGGPSIDTFMRVEQNMAVSVGENEQGDPVIVDVGGPTPYLITSDRGEVLSRIMRGIGMNIAVEESLGTIVLHMVTSDSLFDTFDAMERHADYSEALESLRSVIADRNSFIGCEDWNRLTIDPNYGEAWRPVVYVFSELVTAAQYQELTECLSGPDLGVGIMVSMSHDELVPEYQVRMRIDSTDQAILFPEETRVRPHQLEPSKPMRELLEASVSEVTTPAWWDQTPHFAATATLSSALFVERYPDMFRGSISDEPKLTPMTTFSHPTLKILGPIYLEGARGTPPPRAERSCMEYCGWLLEHPGTTAMAMSQGLMVAEGTRRSNMSRLRTWLGNDSEGKPYLPEAYSGRIWLDPAITSDWHRLCLIIHAGITHTTVEDLADALNLVRGAPLADATPGQWHWAEEVRTDIISVIRDIGAILTEISLKEGDIDQARWAASRALVVAPEDEILLRSRLLTEHAAGNRVEVERLATWITRSAKHLGMDLLPETVQALREVFGSKRE